MSSPKNITQLEGDFTLEDCKKECSKCPFFTKSQYEDKGKCSRFSNKCFDEKLASKYIQADLNKKGFIAFRIETEETVSGFPDMLVITQDSSFYLLEIKDMKKGGKFVFRPTQKNFYKHFEGKIPMFFAYMIGNKKYNIKALPLEE